MLTPFNAATEAAAVATVAEQHAAGADFIKVGLVTPDVLYAAQAEATRRGIAILGHLPRNVDVYRASRGGFTSIEHLGPGPGILAACSTDEAGVRGILAALPGIKIPKIKLPLMNRFVAHVVKKFVINPVARIGGCRPGASTSAGTVVRAVPVGAWDTGGAVRAVEAGMAVAQSPMRSNPGPMTCHTASAGAATMICLDSFGMPSVFGRRGSKAIPGQGIVAQCPGWNTADHGR